MTRNRLSLTDATGVRRIFTLFLRVLSARMTAMEAVIAVLSVFGTKDRRDGNIKLLCKLIL
jgi:hypothetical protein